MNAVLYRCLPDLCVRPLCVTHIFHMNMSHKYHINFKSVVFAEHMALHTTFLTLCFFVIMDIKCMVGYATLPYSKAAAGARCALPPMSVFATAYTGGSPPRYFRALLNLAQSLVDTGSMCHINELVVLAHGINASEYSCLDNLGFQLLEVPFVWLDETRPKPLRWQTFLKLASFNLTRYNKIVFLDVDGIAVQNLHALFSYPSLSAVRSKARARLGLEYFNTGVMVIEPSPYIYQKICQCWRSGNYHPTWYGEKELTEQELLLHCLQAEFHRLPGNFNCKMRKAASRKGCAFLHRKWWTIRAGSVYYPVLQHINILVNAAYAKLCVVSHSACISCQGRLYP